MTVDWILARVRSGVNVMSDMLVAILLDRGGDRAAVDDPGVVPQRLSETQHSTAK
jgi:Na+/H+-dicarboxylate symporter